MRLLISYIILSTAFLLSCNNTNNSNLQYILSINSLSLQLDNAAKNNLIIDSLSIVEISKKVKYNCSKIDYQNDNMNNKVIIQYSKINSSLEQILKMDLQIKKDIAKSITQLNNLLYDLNNNLVDTLLLARYIEDEKKNINKIIDRINYNYESYIVETNRYDSLNLQIENLIHQ